MDTIQLIIKFRKAVIIACLSAGACFAALIPFSRTDPEIRNYIPPDMPSRIRTDSIEKEFGIQDIVMILFSDSCIVGRAALEQVKSVDRALSRLPGISNRISPFTMRSIKGEDGMMVAGKLIGAIPGTADEEEELRQEVLSSRFVRDMVISSDFTKAAITATVNENVPETRTIAEIDSILGSAVGPATVFRGGLPYIRKYIISDVRKDGILLVPLALAVMLLILRLSLKRWKLVMMPFAVVCLSTAISMGMIPLFGWKLSIITLLVPIILVAVANNYGIYLVARYQALQTEPQPAPAELLKSILGSLSMPVLFSGFTTIAGILGLLTHSVIPARQVGIIAAAGVTIALLMSLTLIPAFITYAAGSENRKDGVSGRKPLSPVVMDRIAAAIVRHPVGILIVSVLFVSVLSAGILFLRTDTNQENYFPRNHPMRQSSELINKNFGGSQTMSLMISGDILDPGMLRGIDSLTAIIACIPGVGSVYSVSQVVREMSKAIFDSEETGYDAIPPSRDGVSQMFELYNMSGSPDDFNQLINSNNRKAHILVRLSDPQNSVIRKVENAAKGLSPMIQGEITTGGYALIMADFAQAIIRGQVSSLVFALLTVFLLLAVIFRSVKGGLIGTIPLAASLLVLFGFMGFAAIPLDAATALLSSLMIGVGVDFTIQYIWCFNSFLRTGETYEKATGLALNRIGSSIVINAASVMAGFSVLVLSGFASIRFFGYLVMISIGSCLAGALFIIPAFMLVFRPDFASKQLIKTQNKSNEDPRSNIDTHALAC